MALFDTENGMQQPLVQERFPSDDYPSLEAIISQFLTDKTVEVEVAAFGVAGPVVDGRSQITNLSWTIDAGVVADTLGLGHVHLLNDLEAIANAVPHLESDDLVTLHSGQAEKNGAMAVIAPGTGLGEAFLIWTGSHYRAFPSEGGHTAFGPGNAEQIELLRFLHGRYRHVSYERVCSGIGIPNLYNYLKWSSRHPEPEQLAQALAAAEDPTPVIVTAAIKEEIPLCLATLDLFVDILGDEAGNLALKVLATGGVYIGGGIPPRILPQLQQPRFLAAFRRKGRFADMMQKMPIHVIRNPQTALLGAAFYGLETG
ncbi:MAG: glucokinase [Anaerolineae bacterium]